MNNEKTTNPFKTLGFITALLLCYPIFLVFFPISVLPLEETVNFADLLNFNQLLIALFIISFVTYATWQLRLFLKTLSTNQFILLAALIAIPFIGVYPGDADDFFTNFWYAERVLNLNENPYQTEHYQENYGNHQSDLPGISPAPFLPYGPLWLGTQTIIYAAINSLSIVPKVLIYKTIQFFLWLITLYVVDKLIDHIKPESKELFRPILLSPWLLLAMVGTAHNDLWMLLLITLSVSFLYQKKYFLSLSVLLISVFFKYITLVLIPIFILHWLRHSQIPTKLTKQYIGVSALLLICLFALFEYSLGIFSGIFNQAGLSGYSLTYGLSLLFRESNLPFIQQSLYPFIFFGLYGWIIYRFWESERSFENVITSSALTIGASFIFVTQLWGYWYLVWIIPLLLFFSQKTLKFFYLLGSAHVILFFWLWTLFKANRINQLGTEQFYFFAPTLMISLTLTLFIFLVQLWNNSKITD